MLQIKYNEGFLDLGADQKLEFERENPLFILEDFYKEYSSPIVIKYSENNVALLGAIFFELLPHQKQKLEVELWEKGTFDSNVVLVIDKANPDRRNAGKGDVNGFLLAGLSRFFSNIKYRFLNTLQLGGQRNFTFTTDNPTDDSDGYFQHFFATSNNTFDYIIAPIRNDIFNGTVENSSGWMNDWLWQKLSNAPLLTPTTNRADRNYYSQNEHKYAVVFPRLKYVLTQIFIENGFTLDTSALDGTNWEELFLESLFPIYFYNSLYLQIYNNEADSGVLTQPFANSITIDLSRCISPEITCADFIIQICKKYGWTLIESDSVNFRLIALKGVKSFPTLDITNYVSDAVQTDFSIGERIQGFTNTFPSGEQFASGETPQLAGGKYFEDPVQSTERLPDLSNINKYNLSTYDNSLIFVYNENKYYSIQLIKSTVTVWNNTRGWAPFVDNIYNLEPPNSTESIKSNVTTLPVYWTMFSISDNTMPLIIAGIERDNVLLYGHFPICKQSRFNNWGIRTMQFVGMVNAYYMQTATGPLTLSMSEGSSSYTSVKTISTFSYPLLSCCRNNGVANVLPWSNTNSHIDSFDNVDYGISDYWFKAWLDTIGLTNTYEQNIYLPRNLLKQLTYDTILNINNIPYLMKSYTEPRPYKEFVLAKLVRLCMNRKEGTVTISPNVYVKLYWENVESHADFTQDFIYRQPIEFGDLMTVPIPYLFRIRNMKQGELIIKAYSDPLEQNLIPNLYLSILLRITIKDTSGLIQNIIQFNDFAPQAEISLKSGNYNAKIYLKDGTANIPLSTLYNDTDLIPWTTEKVPFSYIYNTFALNPAVAGRGLDGPFENNPINIPFTFLIPQPILPRANGKYIQSGTVDVPSQFCGDPIRPNFYSVNGALAYTKDIIQEVQLRYSSNYIIIA